MPKIKKLLKPDTRQRLIAEILKQKALQGIKTDSELACVLGMTSCQVSKKIGANAIPSDFKMIELQRVFDRLDFSNQQILSVFGRSERGKE